MQSIDLDSLEPNHLPDQPKPLPGLDVPEYFPSATSQSAIKSLHPDSIVLSLPFAAKTEIMANRSLDHQPACTRSHYPLSLTPRRQRHLHPPTSTLFPQTPLPYPKRNPTSTSFDPKYAQQSLSLLQTALQENAQNSVFARPTLHPCRHIPPQGLPPSSTLTEAEKTSLRSAAPGCFMLPESAHNSKIETGLVGKYKTRHRSIIYVPRISRTKAVAVAPRLCDYCTPARPSRAIRIALPALALLNSATLRPRIQYPGSGL